MSADTSLTFPRSAVPVPSGRIPVGRTVLASAIRAAHRADTGALLAALPDAAALSALPGWPEVTGTAPEVAVLHLPADPLVM